ncbi:MAG: bifunctional 4-hydroxy-2-oxoglutarate aldolase/2-dehydro-3-deoxy-phosphogluconate aldolase [Albidovulum sp.]|nr:bifunctional 4-hydroxy-2-oxoglutarate aldolase/2-dehydro-3-deoxy-phosphogluconate aldolase [Albidovulum sp.]
MPDTIDISKRISEIGVVPVVLIDDSSKAVALTDALLEAGLPLVEITLRTRSAMDSIEEIARMRPEMLVGAGTVLFERDATRAVEAGAKFLVSPGIDPDMLKLAKKLKTQFIPGFMTPSELAAALKFGCQLAKFFPAEANGGPSMLASVCAPFLHTNIGFIPTGGINLENMMNWLRSPRIRAVGGSWIASRADIDGSDWAGITRKARVAVELANERSNGDRHAR